MESRSTTNRGFTNPHETNHVPVLVANATTGDLETVVISYHGPIPAPVVRKFTKYFKRQSEKGVYYPANPMDVYHEAWLALEKRANNLPSYVTSPVGYLISASRVILLKMRQCMVDPLRAEYRAVENTKRPTEQCDTGCDQEVDASCASDERVSYDANDLAEMLVDAPDPATVQHQVVACLEETFAKLPLSTVTAFRAWIAADGKLGLAAEYCGESRFAYRRAWPKRTRAFRAACTWSDCAFL